MKLLGNQPLSIKEDFLKGIYIKSNYNFKHGKRRKGHRAKDYLKNIYKDHKSI